MSIDFLGLEDILEIHQDQISRYGGSPEIRDKGLLLSALAMPQAQFGGKQLHQDIFEMAAAYLFHIVSNHPFVDGNKRTGTMAAFMFLGLNGIALVASGKVLGDFVFEVAQGKVKKAEVAHFLKTYSKKIERKI